MIEAPQHDLSSVVGHAATKQYFTSAISQARLPHALLLHGPLGVGKLSISYALAKLLNCAKGGVECKCDICRKIAEGVFADLLVVEPRGAAGQITLAGWKPGKDDPDGLQYYRFVDSRPLEGARKILIFRQAERMNVALSNYLLKLIEEPPSYLVIVLLALRKNDVLTTIRSRCAPVRLNPLSSKEMEEFIAKQLPADVQKEARRIMPLAEGRPGSLVGLLDDAGSSRRAEIARLMAFFQQHGFMGLFRVASDLLATGGGGRARAGDNLEQVLELLQSWIRDAMLLKVASPEVASSMLLNLENRKELQEYANAASLDGLAAANEYVRDAAQFVPRMTDRSYVLETLLLKMGRALK